MSAELVVKGLKIKSKMNMMKRIMRRSMMRLTTKKMSMNTTMRKMTKKVA